MSRAIISIITTFIKYYFPFLVIFIAALYMPADTDLGWHLKYGEYFFNSGNIVRENIFSLEMPNYKWSNSSWLTDIITFSIFRFSGFPGLTIAGALVITFIFLILSKALRLSFWDKAFIFPLLFFIEIPLFRVSFRGQLITTLFTAVLIFIISEFQKSNKKIIYFSIPLFFLWGNLHGGFLIGLVILSFYILLKLANNLYSKNINEFKSNLMFLGIILLSYLSLLFNPFGVGVYSEVLKHFGNPYQKFILEWLPLPPFSNLWWILVFWGIFLIMIIREIVSKNKFNEYFEWIVICGLMYFASFWMRRYAWSMYILSMPIVAYFLKENRPAKNIFLKNILPICIFVGIYFYCVFYHIPRERINEMSWERYCNEFIKCSSKSAEFLLKNKFEGKFLSNYNWGGWLIWNYPEIKPSIDGRMHLWQDQNGYSAFGKYYFLEQNINDIDKSDYDVIFMTTEKPLFNRLEELTKEKKWIRVYKDDFAGIFVRVKKTT